MASSSSPSAPAFSSQTWKYHVFLSFRGEDTRKTFVDHLYSALEQQGIHTYKDDQTLPRGESIGPSLLKAIEESQIAVINFSENYAHSSWCLDELACIMICKDTKGQIVMPIFYGVDPSEVRKQKRKYGEAFVKYELENKKKVKSLKEAIVDNPWGWLSAPREQNRKYQEAVLEHELENKRKVEGWRKALVDASNISGWEPKHVANGHESRVIKEIVDTISQRLQLVTSNANENLIGMAARMQCLRSELQVGTGGVSMIGIWGVGGGGKTTLASCIFDEISGKFDGSFFLNNIREESRKIGLEKLQEKILSGVLKQSQVQTIGRVEEGRRIIKDRLSHRKVLIVLDDVDHLDQLRALVGSHDSFGGGSRILVTTRDVHLLNSHKVDVMHNITLLTDDEAIMLFRKLSPQDNRPKEDYERLSKEVVSYAGGLPLALTVLGSFLCDKDVDEWMSALARLKKIPNNDVLGKLKISFDGLAKLEQELFLDIACLYRWEGKDKAMEMLDACGFHAVIGVKVLIQKALITITNDGWFDMHDLVQEMGHHIVWGEHPNSPEKHSRIWKKKDVLKICDMDVTTELDKIEAIKIIHNVFLEKEEDLPLIAAKMENLRHIESGAKFANPLHNNFPPRKLSCLILYSGLQKQLWDGCKLLPNLKMMELYLLKYLITTPDFNGLPNLERLSLSRCWSLEEIDPSIGRLKRLVLLSVKDCRILKIFPPVTRLQKLKTLLFSECPKLFNLLEDSDDSGREVASYIQASPKSFVTCLICGRRNLAGVECCLKEACLPHKNMKPSLPDNNMNHIALRFFLKDLKELCLSDCRLGDEEMGSAVWELPNLKTLDLIYNDFSRLSFSHLRLPRLKLLDVSCCQDLVELSDLPSSIAVVKANYCCSLESFGNISNCPWLWNVSLLGDNGVGDCDILLDSMLQGNASEAYFIQIGLAYQIPQRFVGRLFRGRTFTLRLPDDWYNDFQGFLICTITREINPNIKIVMKQEVDKDPLCKGRQESNEPVKLEYDNCLVTCVGYVSFGSLRNTTFWSSSYTAISVDIQDEDEEEEDEEDEDEDEDEDEEEEDGDEDEDEDRSCVKVELVPRKSKSHQPQTTKLPTTDSSQFYEDRKTFTIQHDSKSSTNIFWRPECL